MNVKYWSQGLTRWASLTQGRKVTAPTSSRVTEVRGRRITGLGQDREKKEGERKDERAREREEECDGFAAWNAQSAHRIESRRS